MQYQNLDFVKPTYLKISDHFKALLNRLIYRPFDILSFRYTLAKSMIEKHPLLKCYHFLQQKVGTLQNRELMLLIFVSMVEDFLF